MSIEQCSYNGGKMCQRIGQCYKEALLETQAQEGGTQTFEPGDTNPGPYMTLSQWEGVVNQITNRIEECGNQEEVRRQLEQWDATKRDPENGFLQDTGSVTLPSGWYDGSKGE
ncbi:hypothetical protein IPM65_06150 [Candidatus Roizmanbacteria bacterium]|nr:MAG: hypothetical protein IPM65_06150 [Candidatus Roizmanbacteria bacterium]